MMPVNEENKELRDLVAETLKAKGVLGKVQAEIRASVFLALEEQDVFNDKSPFLNKALKDFCKTSDGLKVLSLVREFLEFFNLEFTAMVFDPETHAGIDYSYEGRNKLATDLKLDSPSAKLPLLAQVISQSKQSDVSHSSSGLNGDGKRTVDSNSKDSQLNNDVSPEPCSMNGDSDGLTSSKKLIRTSPDYHVDLPRKNGGTNRVENAREKTKSSDANSLTSLSNLPPLNAKMATFTNTKGNDLKSLIDFGLNSSVENNSVSEGDKHSQSRRKDDSVSEDSEIEEEIPSHNSNASGTTAISVKTTAVKREKKRTAVEASVSEELLKLKALSLSFVKEIPMKLVGQLTQSLSDKSYSGEGKDLSWASDCETMSDVDDIEDETFSKVSITEKTLVERNRNSQ